jgi:hypothetical protein
MTVPPDGTDDGDITLDPDAETAPPAEPPRRFRVRGTIAAILGVLAIVSLMAATVAVWARVTVFSSDRVATIVGDAVAEPEVSTALADYLTEQVFAAVDVDAALSSVLPDSLTRLEPVLASGARTAVNAGLDRLLSTPEVQETLTRLVERAHRAAMRLLQGDGLVDGITIVDGAVTVNMLPLISRGLERLQGLGLLTDVDLPTLTADGDPEQQIAELESATGRQLPDGFGQLVVYRSDRLAEGQASLESAQQAVALAKRAVWVLVVLTFALVVATILVARNRWRAAMWLGLGGAASMVVVRSAVRRVEEDAPDLATKPGGRAAIQAIVGGAGQGLLRLAGIILIVGAAAAVLALFRRHWRREDLFLVAAVVAFALIVAIAGLSLGSLVAALVVAILIPLLAPRLLT